MAEGFAREILPATWRIASAGLEVHGLNPWAVKVMAEKGVDISKQQSQLIDPEFLRRCDYVVTLCGDARDRCPVVSQNVSKIHWPLVDPAQATGDEQARLLVFRQVRDEIESRVRLFAVQHWQDHDKKGAK